MKSDKRTSTAGTQPASSNTHLNAVKHGLRSDTVLLPGDDPAEFRQRRSEAFDTYQPRTADEAECVETIVEMTWRNGRARQWQQVLDAQVTAHCQDAAGLLAEPDTHRRLHGTIDCTLHQQRLHRLLYRAQDRLVWLQKLRRQHLIAGTGAALPSHLEFLQRGETGLATGEHQPTSDREAGQDPSSEDRGSPQEMGPMGRASAGGLPEAPKGAAPASTTLNNGMTETGAESSHNRFTLEPISGLLAGEDARPTKSEPLEGTPPRRTPTPSAHGQTGKNDERNPSLALVKRYWPASTERDGGRASHTAQPASCSTPANPPSPGPVFLPTP